MGSCLVKCKEGMADSQNQNMVPMQNLHRPPDREAPSPPSPEPVVSHYVQPPSAVSKGPIVLGIYKFVPRGPTELQFEKGDKLEILAQTATDWWRARHLATREEGYVPVTYVASVTSLEAQDWYFGRISREEAEAQLANSVNPTGAFLVRACLTDSDNQKHKFTLSVKISVNSNSRNKQVKHYRVLTNEEGFFYISRAEIYMTLNDLVDAQLIDGNKSDVSRHMKVPCTRVAPTINDLTPDSQWEFPSAYIKLDKKLGSGSFGDVWLGIYQDSVQVAVKTLKQGTMTREQFLEEASIMKKLRHKHILALHAVCTDKDPILIVTEFMCNGSLIDYLRGDEGSNLPLPIKIYIGAQVADGMKYLEKELLIHRDLAARNILVGESLLCKISDFGLARMLQGDEYNISSNQKFPVKWTAPEAYLKSCFTIKSDVWSFGILLMEILTNGAIPYPGMTKNDVMEQVQYGYRMGKPKDCPDEIYELMYSCWTHDMYARPTFEYILDFLTNAQIYAQRNYDEFMNQSAMKETL